MADSSTSLVTPWYDDKAVHAVWTMIVLGVANVIGRKYGLSMNVEEMVGITIAIVAFIVGHKWKTAILQAALIQKSGQ